MPAPTIPFKSRIFYGMAVSLDAAKEYILLKQATNWQILVSPFLIDSQKVLIHIIDPIDNSVSNSTDIVETWGFILHHFYL